MPASTFLFGFTDGAAADQTSATVRVYRGSYGLFIETPSGRVSVYGDESEAKERASAMSRRPTTETIVPVLTDRPSLGSKIAREVATRLTIAGSYSWSGIGYVAEGESGRKEMNGPLVPGPWAYGYPLSHVLDNHGGTGAEQARLRAAGLLIEVVGGERFDIAGTLYEVSLIRRGIDAWVEFTNV